jgi:hypothetical protein
MSGEPLGLNERGWNPIRHTFLFRRNLPPFTGHHSMSKVVRVHEHGGPEVLRIKELDVGRPGAGCVPLA